MIRRAESSDLEAINNLLRQVLKVHHEGRPDLFRAEGKKYSDDEILKLIANPATPVFVYEDEGKVIAHAFCEIIENESGSLMPVKTLYIQDFCVHDASRGKHVGKKLFEYLKTFATEQGCYNINLHVWECNPGAIAFYKAHGMEPQFTSMELILP